MPMLTTLRIGLPVWPRQVPSRTLSANSPMRSSTRCTSGTTSWPSTMIDSVTRRAQRGMQHGAILGDVDLVAAEHGVDAGAQAGLPGQLQQQPEGLVGDPVLGIVEIEAAGLQHHALAALGIVCEQRAQMQVLDVLVVAREGLPGRTFGAGDPSGPPCRMRVARTAPSYATGATGQRSDRVDQSGCQIPVCRSAGWSRVNSS